MKCRTLGKPEYGLQVFSVGLGCMGLSQSYPPFPDRKTSVSFLRRAVELGENFFDTSDSPGIIVTPLALDEFNGPRGDFYKNMFAKCPAGPAPRMRWPMWQRC